MSGAGAERLNEMLTRNHALADRIQSRGFPLDEFELLQAWQRDRLGRSFADLIEQESYRPACNFFLSELYGGLDFLQRDQDMGKVMSVMTRFLPDGVLLSMSEAFELQAISLEYDISMAGYIEREGMEGLDMPSYCAVYRACSDRPGRSRQIELIRKLGWDLDRLVHRVLVTYLVRLLHGPAHAAGFGALQDFLESGLESFRAMEDARYFIETIYGREREAMERMFAGDERPFGF
jgi:hypothetical protein